MEWRGAHSGAALREPFMDVHAMRCILIHTPRVAVPRSAAPLRLQPFARPGTLANAGRPAHVTAFQPTMKSLRRTRARHALVAILSVVAAFLNVINDMVQMREIFVESIAVRSHELEA